MIEQARDLIKKHEGLELKPYLCTAGKTTIGYGRNLDDRGISKKEAEYLLTEDIDIVSHELSANLPWFATAPEPIQIALIDMAFNLGWPRLSKFKNMLGALEIQDYMTAADEAMDSKWAVQVGERALNITGLIRSAEQ